MSEIDKNYLDVAILSILAYKLMNSSEILAEFNQQGSYLDFVAVDSEVQRLFQSNLVTRDKSNPIKYTISTKGRESLGNLLSFLLNHINSRTWERLEPIREGVVKTAQIKPGDVVLDCSSGTDKFSKELSKQVGSKGQVIFLSQDSRYDIEYFEKLIVKEPEFSNISFIIKSEFIGKIESNSIDAVFQIFGLHMYENVGIIMQEMGRILKPGKKIVICDPQEIDHFIFNQYRKLDPSLHTGTTPGNLRNVLKEAGFQNIKVDSVDGLCIASAEKVAKVPRLIPLEPFINKEEKEKEKEKHYYQL